MSPSAHRTAPDVALLVDDLRRHARYSLGRDWEKLGDRERFAACGLVVRDMLVDGLLETRARQEEAGAKRLCYLSMEFLMGRALGNNLINLRLRPRFEAALADLGTPLDELLDEEPDAALGNGGLGRLAACFLDSLATLDLPGDGYGILYEYGVFRQLIDRGTQREQPDHWRKEGTPWTIERSDEAVLVPLYGRIAHESDRAGGYNPMWLDWQVVVGVPHDMPVAGYGGRTVNALRLFSARSSSEFDMEIFNDGDYLRAVEQKIASETISKVLYPSDSQERGRELRLVQEYFLVACAMRDVARRFEARGRDWRGLPDVAAVQLNDTHPALVVAELMRLLVDEQALPWEVAWDVTTRTLAYTNHTLQPEALETWAVPLLRKVLPRHLQIVHEINRRFLDEVAARWPGDDARLRRMSMIEEGGVKRVRMAHLAIAGSHSTNGVAALHSELVKTELVPDFHEMWPERFSNKTNGVTPRRWLLLANPGLAELVTDCIGEGWIRDASLLGGVARYAEDPAFRERFAAVKRANKERLARTIRETTGETLDPQALFDVQAKRIHLYKRQVLHVLHVLHLYLEIQSGAATPQVPRVHVFAGKAAPGYREAKQVIRLIHAVADLVNGDPRVRDVLRVVFLPDYRVSLAERVVPAADLSEQISTAGTEASGTGIMKLALNGALTIGTLDGANIEIRAAVGGENAFVFGHSVEEIAALRAPGRYHPAEIYEADRRVRQVMDFVTGPQLGQRGETPFAWLFPALVTGSDTYFHLADLPSYIDEQERVAARFAERDDWLSSAVLNTALTGRFSSDRTVLEYADEIWGLERV
jgi:starch phosphorylase